MVRSDEFTARYADLLTGSYDCVDRIVLNAYYPLGHNPGGFRVWWRRWHDDGDETLDNAHLMRLAGRFARRVKAWGSAHDVPVVFCKAGERKHRIAEDYLAEHTVGVGVFLVLVDGHLRAQRPGPGRADLAHRPAGLPEHADVLQRRDAGADPRQVPLRGGSPGRAVPRQGRDAAQPRPHLRAGRPQAPDLPAGAG